MTISTITALLKTTTTIEAAGGAVDGGWRAAQPAERIGMRT
jgi:hypothetical protein